MKFFKSCLALVLTLLMLLPVLCMAPLAEGNKVLTPTKLNTTRGDGDLVVYTPAFGKTTNTNEWGAEAVIDANGKCTYVGTDGNNPIPEGGFVVSGHDSDDGTVLNKTLVLETFKVGIYAAFNEPTMKVTVSDQPILSSSDYEVSISADGANCGRFEDQLILYNRSGEATGTNTWGYEVVVTNSVVTAVGGNNSTVPTEPNSFVLSGHGTKAKWLQESVVLGMTVTQNGMSFTFKFDATSSATSLKLTLETIKKKLENAKANFAMIDYDKSQQSINALEAEVNAALKAYEKDKNSDALNKKCEELTKKAAEISTGICESPAVEYRGVWIRPTQTTESDVDAYVQKLYDAGINLVCIETLYDSCMIMPMPEDSLFKQNPKWKGFDMLKAFIDSCHKRNMELHIWMPVFYVGHSDGANASLSVGTKKRGWLSKNNLGEFFPSDTNEHFYMLDPSNAEACDFLIETYRYILQNYDIDGFEMDYIRYWATGAEDWGYNDGMLNAFKEKYGVRPMFDPNAAYWNNWCDFRASYVTDMVYRIRELIDEVKPDVLLTADVAADEQHSKRAVYQYYHEWLDEGVLDVVHPMAYGNTYYGRITDVNEMCGDDCYFASGLGTFDSAITADALVSHTEHIINIGGNGAVFFEASSYLSRNLYSLLKPIYSIKATVPTADNAINLFLEYEFKRIDERMVPAGALTADQAKEIKEKLNAFASSSKENESELKSNKDALHASIAAVKSAEARGKLNAVANTLSRMMYMHDRIDRKLSAPDVTEIPDEPDKKPTESDESTDNTDNTESGDTDDESNVPDSSSTESDNGEGEEQPAADPAVIIIIVTASAVLAIAAVSAVYIKNHKK